MSNDFPPTDQDVVVSRLLTSQIKEQVERYNKLVKEDRLLRRQVNYPIY